MTTTLDIGCGKNLRGPDGASKWGLDIVDNPDENIVKCDVTWDKIPFNDESFDRVYAYDFLEHVPMRVFYKETSVIGTSRGVTRDCMLELFDEVYRVLKPGGVFETFTPHLPHTSEVYRDPTHVSVWVEDSWEYWAGSMTPLMRHYGYKAEFKIIKKRRQGAHLHVELQK